MVPIDWGRPWFAALQARQACAGCIGDGRLDLGPLNAAASARAIRTVSGRPLSFVEAHATGPRHQDAASYERRVFREGCVATRTTGDGALHDLFNALIWLRFPRAKARLNALQVQALDAQADLCAGIGTSGTGAAGAARDARHARQARGAGGRRGALRDAITLLDESGLVLATARPRLLEPLARRDWSSVLVAGRDRWLAEVRPVPFGHGLLQKLVQPFKALTAHALILPVEEEAGSMPAEPQLDRIDAALARALDATALACKPFVPLPVLGIPGWWPANREPAFYNDPSVFRPARAGQAPGGNAAPGQPMR